MKRFLIIVAAVASSLSLAACGETVIDVDKAESEIAKGYEQQVPGSKVKAVDCPDEIKAVAETKATCKMTLEDGSSGNINLRVLDDKGNIRWDVANPAS